MQNGRRAAKIEPVIERFDIYADPGDILIVADKAKVATQIFVAALLMAQRLAYHSRDLCEQLGGGHLRSERQADRRHVGAHGNSASQSRDTPGHWHIEDQVTDAGRALKIV